MNKLKEILTLNKALGQYNGIAKEVNLIPPKSLFLSKTFWLNVLGLVATLAPILPAKIALPVLAILNIGNRLATNQPVTINIPWKN